MSRCYNLGLKHNFKPRYDEVEMEHSAREISGMLPADIRSLLVKNVYVRDICTWCGDIKERPHD